MAYQTMLTKFNNTYTPMISNQLQVNGIEMTEYQKTCVIASIKAINNLLTERGEKLNDFDQNNVTDILLSVAALQLNADATPREVYFIVRNHKRGNGPKVEQLEMGIEGDGNDAMLSRFGRDVKQVYPFWKVREQDPFSYPKHKGLEVIPPEWEETGQGKVVRVVYPIKQTDGAVEYYIGEREDVLKNLMAHVSNNLMWDKGDNKAKFIEKSEGKTLDQILDDPELVKIGKISPAWSEPQSRESMILRKMRNNVVKKIPKDFGSALVATRYAEQTDGDLKRMRKDVTEQANAETIEISEPQPTQQQRVQEAVQQAQMQQAETAANNPAPKPQPEPTVEPESEGDPF
jgi:hypothetical protein